jgi:hypothetical protein
MDQGSRGQVYGAPGRLRIQGIQEFQGTTRDLRIQESTNQGAPIGVQGSRGSWGAVLGSRGVQRTMQGCRAQGS